jgi:hypothetical protein
MSAWVWMESYDHWHTAEVRGEWEDCTFRTTRTANYLCSKDWDFQSTFTHEINHTLGLGHSQDIAGGVDDGHCVHPTRRIPNGNPEYRLSDPAMTCQAYRNRSEFTTARRTLFHLHDNIRHALDRQMRSQLD